MHRLRVVVLDRLAPGLQAAQEVHAALAWQVQHPALAAAWMARSNTVAILEAPT